MDNFHQVTSQPLEPRHVRSAFDRAGESGDRMLERERIIEIVVAVGAVLLMLGVMVMIGSEYGTEDSTLSTDGGELLVIAIVGFIFLLTIVGVALAFLLNDPESPDDDDVDTPTESSDGAG